MNVYEEPVEEDHDKIVVFRHYDTAIDANLAKTKLDAHGVPCFLTEENLATLYTGQSYRLFAVRLHLFSNDVLLADQILNDQILVEQLSCPHCRSQKVEIQYSRKFTSILVSVLSLLIAALLPNKKVHRCQDCGFEF